jgi:hypothetical protein
MILRTMVAVSAWKSAFPGYFDASKQKEKPLRGTKELCYPSVLETLIFIEDAGWPVYGIRSLSVREGGGTQKNNADHNHMAQYHAETPAPSALATHVLTSILLVVCPDWFISDHC